MRTKNKPKHKNHITTSNAKPNTSHTNFDVAPATTAPRQQKAQEAGAKSAREWHNFAGPSPRGAAIAGEGEGRANFPNFRRLRPRCIRPRNSRRGAPGKAPDARGAKVVKLSPAPRSI